MTYLKMWYHSGAQKKSYTNQGLMQNNNLGEQSKPCRNLGVSRGMLPQENFENLGVNFLNFN